MGVAGRAEAAERVGRTGDDGRRPADEPVENVEGGVVVEEGVCEGAGDGQHGQEEEELPLGEACVRQGAKKISPVRVRRWNIWTSCRIRGEDKYNKLQMLEVIIPDLAQVKVNQTDSEKRTTRYSHWDIQLNIALRPEDMQRCQTINMVTSFRK